jgi:hypothetical protein
LREISALDARAQSLYLVACDRIAGEHHLEAVVFGRIVRRGKVDTADRAVLTDRVRHRRRGRRSVANERFKPMSHNYFRAFSGKLLAQKARVVSDNHRAFCLVGKLSADSLSHLADRRESKFVGDDGSPA